MLYIHDIAVDSPVQAFLSSQYNRYNFFVLYGCSQSAFSHKAGSPLCQIGMLCAVLTHTCNN